MGPRSGERGEFSEALTILPDWAASMGPRSGERGESASAPSSAPALSRFNGAALG